MIPLVDLKAQYRSIKDELDAAVMETMSQTAFIMGDKVSSLETDFASFCGTKYGIGVSSATCGLHLVLHSLGVGPGDEVIIPSHTFIATAEAVCHCGATPVFTDIDATTLAMDARLVEPSITSRTKAVMPVHIYGRCADMNAINQVARIHNLPVVEDAAQAHGALCADGRAGNMGIAGVFSFYPGKNLGAFGDGGMVVTADRDLYQRMHMLANHGRTSKYVHEMIGFNYRLDALQAAIVAVKLKHLHNWNQKRLILARRYNEAFSSYKCIVPDAPEGHVFHLYELRVGKRDQLLERLKSEGIGAGIHYPIPCHMQPCFNHLKPVTLPVTERIVNEIISLPIYPEMTAEQQDIVIEHVTDHCEANPLCGS